MPKYEMPSIKKEIENLEGENPAVRLSVLEEELVEVDRQGKLNAWPPDERVRRAELKKEIAELEKVVEYKKAA